MSVNDNKEIALPIDQPIEKLDKKTGSIRNIKDWKRLIGFVDITQYPALPCPYCEQGVLHIDIDTLVKKAVPEAYKEISSRHYQDPDDISEKRIESRLSRINTKSDGWNMLLSLGVLLLETQEDSIHFEQCTSFLTCEHCQTSVTATGLLKVHTSAGKEKVRRLEKIKFDNFTPAIPMMYLSQEVPSKIRIELLDSFKHFHFDPTSAAAKLRRAIETFCHDLELEGKGLHQQISSMSKVYPEEAKYLMALKLLGNEGSHVERHSDDKEVEEIDILQGYCLFEYVLELYDRKARFKATMADFEKINAKFSRNKQTKLIENKPL